MKEIRRSSQKGKYFKEKVAEIISGRGTMKMVGREARDEKELEKIHHHTHFSPSTFGSYNENPSS